MTERNDYTHYNRMMEMHDGEKGERGPGVAMSDPQPGRYRIKRRGQWKPVAIWFDDGGDLHVVVAGERIPDTPAEIEDVWTSCAFKAISELEYDRLLTDSPDDPVYTKIPADPDKMTVRVKQLAAIPTQIEDADDARYLADIAHALKTIENLAGEQLKDEAAAVKAKLATIKGKWEPPETLAKATREPIMAALAAYLKTKNEPGGVKGQLGKAISLRTYKKLEITDYAKTLAHFVESDPEAFRTTVEKLARAAIKDGAVPGVETTDDRKAQ